MSKGVRRYLITLFIGLIIAAGVLGIRAQSDMTLAEKLCDALFVPGILLLSLGILIFVANDGMFDMITFGCIRVLNLFILARKRKTTPMTFFEYRTMKHDRDASCGFLIVCGAIYLAAAGLCCAMVYFG